MCRWIASACRPSAALPPQKRATATEADQWKKLALIREIAEEIWG